MIETTDLDKRVERGAKMLDEYRPGWYNDIDIFNLMMREPGRCILGQLSRRGDGVPGGYSNLVTHLAVETRYIPAYHGTTSFADYHGFDLPDNSEPDEDDSFDATWEYIQDRWEQAVRERRMEDKMAAEVAEAAEEDEVRV